MLTSLNREVFKAVGTVVVGLFIVEIQRWLRRRRFNNVLDSYGTATTSSITVIAACTDRTLQEDGINAAFERLLRGVSIRVLDVAKEADTVEMVLDLARRKGEEAREEGVEYGPIVILLGLCQGEMRLNDQGDRVVDTHWVALEDVGTGRRVYTNSSGIRQDWKECAAKALARRSSIAASVEVAWLDLFHDE